MKKCRECKEIKELSEFYENKIAKDRLYNDCKSCMTEKRREYHKEWAKRNKEKVSAHHKKWRKLNQKEYASKESCKLKQRCRFEASRKISLDGKICEDCGKTKNLQRHHDDYSKPLEVKILCPKCHSKLHHK